MLKHYHTIWISFIWLMAVSLSVTFSPHGLWSGQGLPGLVSSAQADDDYGVDGYDHEGRNREGRDRNGFDREGYSRDGHDRDGYDKDGYRNNGKHRDGHYDGGHDRHKKRDKKNVDSPTTGAEPTFKGSSKPMSVKQY